MSLNDNEPLVRQHAAAALGNMGPSACGAVPALRNLILDHDWLMRDRVAYALWQIDHQVEVPLPILVGVLKQGEVKARAEAAQALGEIGPPAIAAVPALVQALQDYEFIPIEGAFCGYPCSVSSFAEDALKRIDPEAAALAGVRPKPWEIDVQMQGAQ
jgi:HEAT repeat protein